MSGSRAGPSFESVGQRGDFAITEQPCDFGNGQRLVVEIALGECGTKLFQNFIMAPENAALISMFARYANGIKGSEQFMEADFANAPEIKAPTGSPEPEFVPPCSKEVVDQYNKIWTNLLK